MMKSTAYDALVHRAPNVLTSRDKEDYVWRRRLLAQGLSDSSMRKIEGDIIQCICSACDRIKTTCSMASPDAVSASFSTLDISQWCLYSWARDNGARALT
jgi:cytochrome P450